MLPATTVVPAASAAAKSSVSTRKRINSSPTSAANHVSVAPSPSQVAEEAEDVDEDYVDGEGEEEDDRLDTASVTSDILPEGQDEQAGCVIA